MDLEGLPLGHKLPTINYRLSQELVRDYLTAVQDDSSLYNDSQWVPPTAIAALTVKALLEGMSLPSGTVHVAQELEFLKPLSVGQEITCGIKVAQNSVRKQWRFLVLDIVANQGPGQPVMRGKSTLLTPLPSNG